MTRYFPAALAFAFAVPLLVSSTHAQSPAPLAGAVLGHIGMAVRDIDAAAKHFSEVFGAPVSAPMTVTADSPSGTATFKTAQLKTLNFQIDLAQPVGPSALQTWIDTYGDGVQHVGLTVPDSLPTRIKALEDLGGKVTLGVASGSFAFVDLTTLLGTTLEITQRNPRASVEPHAPGAPVEPRSSMTLAQNPVQHIGLVVPDVEKTARAFGDLLGVPLPRFNVVPNPAFPSSYTGDPKASVKTISFKVGDLNMEFQQSSPGSNPWNDFGARVGGAGVEYVAFRVGDNLTPMRRQLERVGAKMAIGNEESGYSQYDASSTLGVWIEVLGTPKRQ